MEGEQAEGIASLLYPVMDKKAHLVPLQSPFKISALPQCEELAHHLKTLMCVDPYNRFCIDCLHAQTSHALLPLGIFLCKNCA